MTTLFSVHGAAAFPGQRAESSTSRREHRTHELLATLGHELRNPLSALSHALEIWPSAMLDPARMEELRSVMQRQVHQLTSLSDNLLDTARITRGTFELHLKQIELKQLIDEACEEVRPFIDQCGHQLSVTFPREPLVLYGDASRLLQVFANLLQNAAKFTDRGGSLSVTVACRAKMAEIRIRDNGAGIDPANLAAIFAPFAQFDRPGSPGNHGLGIGLPLVKTIVERHGGDVVARSEGVGCGSEFQVKLPLLPGPVSTRSRTSKQRNTVGKGAVTERHPFRMMVVDDARFSAELLSQLLRPLVQDVLVADNGATAIQMALAERPQVVFLDMVMPGLDGCDVARALRAREELSGLVLIALSGNGDRASKRRALDAGFDKYLVKPTSMALLTETLASIPAMIRARQA